MSGTAEARVVKFCAQVDYVKSKHTNDKSTLEGAWSRSCDPFKFCGPSTPCGSSAVAELLVGFPVLWRSACHVLLFIMLFRAGTVEGGN